MSDLWEYGGAYKNLDMSGEIALPNGSVVSVCDLVERMPCYMKRADTLFVDPPWNTGNIRSFYTKADEPLPAFDFLGFTAALWGRIDEIKPRTLFVEMGKQHLWRYLEQAERRYKYVTFYNSTYYDKRDNLTYVIHATDDHATRRRKALEGMDEARIIAWVCANTDYGCIGDLCMGRGLVGRNAWLAGKPFVGTELNKKRLAVLVDWILKAEASPSKEALRA